MGLYGHEETGPGNHDSPARKATKARKRFLTPFLRLSRTALDGVQGRLRMGISLNVAQLFCDALAYGKGHFDGFRQVAFCVNLGDVSLRMPQDDL